MTEKELQDAILEMARLAGWRVYHTFDSRRSAAGFPDLILIREKVLLALELKSAKGRVTAEQQAWLEAFDDVKYVDAFIVRPAPTMDEIAWLLGVESAP